MTGQLKAGVIGASGYLGAELLRLLAGHGVIAVAAVQGDSSSGLPVGELFPGLASAYNGVVLDPVDPSALDGFDVVFVAVPSGHSTPIVVSLVDTVGCVVDLGADFRLKDPAAYPTWYGFAHGAPELLARAVYGLPELSRAGLAGARLVAAPGCYVTAASIALAPLVGAGVIAPRGIIVDAASGTSGAGKTPTAVTHHSRVNEAFSAYGLLDHRHTPEMEQAIGAQVLFTPHLAPMTRGILATCYAAPTAPTSTAALLELLGGCYADEPFVVVDERLPSTGDAYGSNTVHLSARYDERTATVIVLAALDNLTKGGAGQALQAANVALGVPETTGLPLVGLAP